MGARLILEFDSVDRVTLVQAATGIAYEAADIVGEDPWWRVEEAENESQA
jgi:hypothetical protein